MTISTTTSRVSYAGNGVTTIFSFPYRFLANGDLEVTLFDAAGTPDPQTLTTDYTVLGADNDAGGSVTMIVAPAVGEVLVIRRVVELTQETDYISGDSFPAETHERALDRLTMADQQLQEQIDRSITLPLDDETFSGALPAIEPSKFLRVNDTGTALELVDVVASGDLVVSPFIETLLDDSTAAAARTTLGAQAAGSYAGSGANSNITSLSGLTTPLSIAQGGTGSATGEPLSPTGMVAPFARTTAPSGWLALPLTATNISRTTYAALFAVIGTTWGAGDGSTTFGCPYMPANYSPVQANANVGTATIGEVIAHAHAFANGGTAVLTTNGGPLTLAGLGAGAAVGNAVMANQGGAANLAAGVRFLWCVKL